MRRASAGAKSPIADRDERGWPVGGGQDREESGLPDSSVRRFARGDIPVITSGRGREKSPGMLRYGRVKLRLRALLEKPS
jgi:hypothetical protein